MHLADLLSETQTEAKRQLDICNACRYCEGFCAVFPALQRRDFLTGGDLAQLANLCHNCRGCYYACQYSPPHSFALNLPAALAEARVESYAAYAWPRPLAAAFERNGTVLSFVAAIGAALAMVGVGLAKGQGAFAVHQGAGAFYRAISWPVLAGLAGASLIFAMVVLAIGAIRFWRDTGQPGRPARGGAGPVALAASDVLTLRNLGGGGHGCNDTSGAFSRKRRLFHHAMFYGFVLCFVATTSGWFMDNFLAWPAPYPLLSVPVLSGTIGGFGLVIGTAGLLWLRLTADQAPGVRHLLGADVALLALLLAIGGTGLLLLLLRETPAMTLLLALHFGLVLALFVMLPYSKMVHGLYRGLALLRDRQERAAPGSA
jgi:citrate/tricarballylate utilization protein